MKSKLSKRKIDVVIIGAGGHGREVAAYIDDNKKAGSCGVSKILGGLEALRKEISNPKQGKSLYYITALGDAKVRKKIVEKVEGLGKILPITISHQSTRIFHDVKIGKGTCLAP